MFKNCVFKPNVDTVKWLKASLVRAIKTVAQTAVAVIGTATVIVWVFWKFVISSCIVGGIVYILRSIGGIPDVEEE